MSSVIILYHSLLYFSYTLQILLALVLNFLFSGEVWRPPIFLWLHPALYLTEAHPQHPLLRWRFSPIYYCFNFSCYLTLTKYYMLCYEYAIYMLNRIKNTVKILLITPKINVEQASDCPRNKLFYKKI